MNWFKRYYNRVSAKKHGWHPSWFAPYLSDFDNELQDEIVKFQVEHGLKPDGLVGPMTYRRLFADHEVKLEEKKSENYILINGEAIPIQWDVEIDMIKAGSYKKYRGKRSPNMIVTHWDACTSAASCKKVLEARNISTHFCIDNDGVMVHGVKLKPHLGYYPVQIEAYKQLVKTLCRYYKIPLVVPLTENRSLLKKVHSGAARGKFNGIVCHYHLTRGKIDCAGLELKRIIDSLY